MDELGRLSPQDFSDTDKLPIVVVADNIRSLLNVGSIFRSCDAFAVSHLYLCGITGTPPHKEIVKTALGAQDTVIWEHFETVAYCAMMLKEQGYILLGIEQTDSAVKLHEFQFSQNQKYALFLGNEVEGLSEDLLPLLDFALEIPQFGTKHSLNVAVTAGIVLWHYTAFRIIA